MTQGTPRDVVTDTSRMERVQQSGAIARLGWPQDTSTDWEGDIPKDQDKVRDCRERCSSWTGLDDLRGRQPPSPFLYVHFVAERVNDMGLYLLPQHILCTLEPPLNLPIVSQNTRLSHILYTSCTLLLWVNCSHPQSSPAFAQTALRELQPRKAPSASHVYSWSVATTSTFPPAKNTGWNGPIPT